MRYKCGAYYRISKEDEEHKDESSSIESQRMIVESFCKFQQLELIEEYVDDGYSGGNYDRPSFQKMLKDIESKKINCVITKDFSRFGRDLYQTGSYIESYFIDKGIRYIAINDSYDSLVGDNMISMKLTFNDYYLRDISKKVKSSLNARQKKGEYIGSYPKYGYLKNPNDHHKLIIDPVASIIVKKIFDMALIGNSCYIIAETLTQEQIPIPIVYKKESRGLAVTENDGNGIWKPQTVRSILQSEMYIGNMVQNKWNKIRYNSKKLKSVNPKDYIIVENTHEPIIDKETFFKVQDMLKVNHRSVTKNKNKYLFSGLLKCKECGHIISILEKKNKKNNCHYTQCSLYSKKGKYGLCNSHRINYDWLELDLINIIKKIGMNFLSTYNTQDLLEETNKKINIELVNIKKEIELINCKIKKYNIAIENLYLDKIEGKIPINIFDNLAKQYDEKLNMFKNSKKELEEEQIRLQNKNSEINYKTCESIFKEFLSCKTPTRSLIVELFNKIEIDNDKNVKIYFNFPKISELVE